jgi:hypothetical protein
LVERIDCSRTLAVATALMALQKAKVLIGKIELVGL